MPQAQRNHQHRPFAAVMYVTAAIGIMSGQDAILKWLTGD
jgi:hypothetical protein